MKSFLCILAAVIGFVFTKGGDDKSAPTANTGTATTPQSLPRQTRTVPDLQERNLQRDAHLRERLVSSTRHGPTCACGKHGPKASD